MEKCRNGHLLAEENLYCDKQGRTQCRQCRKDASSRFYRNNPGYRRGWDKLVNREDNTRRHREFDRERKAQLVAYKGGKCKDCGGIFPPCVYHFDHINPFDKSFTICEKKHRPIEEVKKEVDKCDLVCANCHAIRTFNNADISAKLKRAWKR